MIYREKIYYFRTHEEKEIFMWAPDVFVSMDTVPRDILFKPTCVVLGPPSSGKSDIC